MIVVVKVSGRAAVGVIVVVKVFGREAVGEGET